MRLRQTGCGLTNVGNKNERYENCIQSIGCADDASDCGFCTEEVRS